MFQPWRIKLREAEEALRVGRLDEAKRLLCDGNLVEFRPGKELMRKVAAEMARRAERKVACGQTLDGLRDLETAAVLGAGEETVAVVRRQIVDRASQEARQLLEAGEPAPAAARLAELERQGPTPRDVRLLHKAAEHVLAAQRLCRSGKFAAADEELAAAAALQPNLHVVTTLRTACNAKAADSRRLAEELHEALLGENWTAVLAAADALLDLSPDHIQARDARRRAWAQVGLRCSDRSSGAHGANGHASQAVVMNPIAEPPSTTCDGDQGRFLLWVDGVGGFLVCLGDEIMIGQPVPGAAVDVPILGDVSRKHAVIRRDGESYLIRALRPIKLDGRLIETVALLTDGSVLELGGGVKLRFRCPHPLARTARLEFISHHRTQPSTDAVLLMADACILGPASTSHVVCPDWTEELVLYRQPDGLHCRRPTGLSVDGAAVSERSRLGPRSTVTGDDFSLSLEPL